jgi:hypothetical protein
MSFVTLLNFTDTPTFAFEHAMAHRYIMGAMAPLFGFSVLPYLIDPHQDINLTASKYFLNHQQAHDDFNRTLPTFYNWQTPNIPQPLPPLPPIPIPQKPFGLSIGQNLVDTNLTDEGKMKWWTFQNHHEHYIANGIIQQPIGMVFPSW